MKKPRHDVSDHALIRYMERGLGLDVEALRRELGRRVDAASDGIDGMNAVIIDGVRYAIQGMVVTTCWEHNLPKVGQCGPKRRREIDDE